MRLPQPASPHNPEVSSHSIRNFFLRRNSSFLSKNATGFHLANRSAVFRSSGVSRFHASKRTPFSLTAATHTGEGADGYLDRMRRNIHALDESIENVRKTPEGEKPVDKRARLKLLRDLVELQNSTLVAVKTHLLGRDETGAANEPPDHWEGNDQIEFERYFKNQLLPWTLEDLKLKCADCKVKTEDVTYREFADIYDPKPPWGIVVRSERANLCPECTAKREVSRQQRAAEMECVQK